ncbi:MAG: hypothetical protein KUL83_08705 [Lentimicrobium sp.]|nr:hypothetical protein [Lentimicrobium sp.]
MRTMLIFICWFLMAVMPRANAQDVKLLAVDYETRTYRLYTEQKWDSLLMVGEEAITEGFDYYYMRARLGIAAFELQKYVLAAKHLQIALNFNNSDLYITQLVHKSLVYSGRVDEARAFLADLPAESAKTIGSATLRPLVYVETGPAFSNQVSKFEHKRQTGKGLYSETYLNNNSFYFLAGTELPLGYRWSVNAAFSAMGFNKSRRVGIAYIDSLDGNYKVRQSEGYLSASFLLGNRIKISPSVRISNVSYNNPLSSDDSLVQGMIGPSNSVEYNDVAYGGELSFLAPYFTATAGFWALEVDKTAYTQTSASIFLRPLGNLNLYTFTILTYKHDGFDGQMIFHQMAGGKVGNKLWGEAFYTLGDLTGTGENNLQVFYNAFEKVKNRYGLRLIYTLNSRLRLSLRGQVFTREGTELYFNEKAHRGIYSYNYQTLSITGGMTWNL